MRGRVDVGRQLRRQGTSLSEGRNNVAAGQGIERTRSCRGSKAHATVDEFGRLRSAKRYSATRFERPEEGPLRRTLFDHGIQLCLGHQG